MMLLRFDFRLFTTAYTDDAGAARPAMPIVAPNAQDALAILFDLSVAGKVPRGTRIEREDPCCIEIHPETKRAPRIHPLSARQEKNARLS